MMRIWVLLVIMCTTLSAQAGVMSASTRVIYDAAQREKSLMLNNTNTYPVIVQSWVDDGSGDPVNAKAPFIVLPAVFRLLPGKTQAIRIIYNQERLPEDRESMFWLNLYEIPPLTGREGNDPRITLAMNTQIKLFFRPKNMSMSSTEAIDKLSFTLLSSAGKYYIECKNPGPFHISFTSLLLSNDKIKKTVNNKNYLILKPFETLKLPVDISANDARSGRVVFRYIDDIGANREKEFPLALK